jgi:hypothetical protein
MFTLKPLPPKKLYFVKLFFIEIMFELLHVLFNRIDGFAFFEWIFKRIDGFA